MSASTIFAGSKTSFVRYAAEVQVQNRLVGGIPKDPDMIRGWIKARLDLGDKEIIELAERTVEEMTAGGVSEGDLDTDVVAGAVARAFEGGNGFKSIDGQLVYEGRCMKAAFKEAANIAYPGVDFPGKDRITKGFRKGLKSTLAERVFVSPEYIPLGVTVPSATEQRVKHVSTPQGPRSAINVVDYVEKPHLVFTVDVLDDFLVDEAWARIWTVIEENGIGSDRARGDGVCTLERWERVEV